MPIVGYLIIYSNLIRELYCRMATTILLNPEGSCISGSTTSYDLHLTYIGLFFLGCGSLLFSTGCPQIFKTYSDAATYVRGEQRTTTPMDLTSMVMHIGDIDKDDANRFLKYADTDMDALPDHWDHPIWETIGNVLGNRATKDVMKTYYQTNDVWERYWLRIPCGLMFLVGFLFVLFPSIKTLIEVARILISSVGIR